MANKTKDFNEQRTFDPNYIRINVVWMSVIEMSETWKCFWTSIEINKIRELQINFRIGMVVFQSIFMLPRLQWLLDGIPTFHFIQHTKPRHFRSDLRNCVVYCLSVRAMVVSYVCIRAMFVIQGWMNRVGGMWGVLYIVWVIFISVCASKHIQLSVMGVYNSVVYIFHYFKIKYSAVLYEFHLYAHWKI